MELYIDDREDNDRIELIKNEFNSNVEVKRLLAGDILIQQRTNPTIVIETKTLQDFQKTEKCGPYTEEEKSSQ